MLYTLVLFGGNGLISLPTAERDLIVILPQFPNNRDKVVCHLRRCHTGRYSSPTVVSTRRNHDELSTGKGQRKDVWHFLGYAPFPIQMQRQLLILYNFSNIPIRYFHWIGYCISHQYSERETNSCFYINLYCLTDFFSFDKSRVLTNICVQVFEVIILCGVASSFLVLPPNKVIRGDGTLVKLQAASSLGDELKGMLKVFTNWRMLGRFLHLGCQTK